MRKITKRNWKRLSLTCVDVGCWRKWSPRDTAFVITPAVTDHGLLIRLLVTEAYYWKLPCKRSFKTYHNGDDGHGDEKKENDDDPGNEAWIFAITGRRCGSSSTIILIEVKNVMIKVGMLRKTVCKTSIQIWYNSRHLRSSSSDRLKKKIKVYLFLATLNWYMKYELLPKEKLLLYFSLYI